MSPNKFAAKLYLSVVLLLCLGYSILGKGFAYLKLNPLYVGDIVLLFGLLFLVVNPAIGSRCLTWPIRFLLPFIIWNILVTIPNIQQYGADSLRDAAVWGYSTYAFVTYSTITRYPRLLSFIFSAYSRFSRLYPFIILPLMILGAIGFQFPEAPGTDVPIVWIKTNEVAVHLSGVTIFGVTFILFHRFGILPTAWLVSCSLALMMVASTSRGGILAYIIAIIFLILNTRSRRIFLRVLLILVIISLIFVMASQFFEGIVLFQNREVDVNQVIINLLSVFFPPEEDIYALGGTRLWRLMWWREIVNYTLLGPYFLFGKGYGVNLADDDGFQVDQVNHSLRSPHNVHMTYLARSGVPGFLLWLSFLLFWMYIVLKTRSIALSNGDINWASFLLWNICYWLAFITAATFDVFLEGPMAGIPFWILTGLGLASVSIYLETKDARFLLPTHIKPPPK